MEAPRRLGRTRLDERSLPAGCRRWRPTVRSLVGGSGACARIVLGPPRSSHTAAPSKGARSPDQLTRPVGVGAAAGPHRVRIGYCRLETRSAEMEALHDHPIRHSTDMARWTASLSRLPAQVLEHSYSHESLGSWTTAIRCRGTLFRLAFDGREGEYRLDASSSREAPDVWRPVWARAAADVSTDPIIEAVRTAADGAR